MKIKSNLIYGAGLVSLAPLGLGATATLFVVPIMSGQLASTFSEYVSSKSIIEILLSTPLALGIGVAIEVVWLLRLLHRKSMFTARIYKWVRLLIATTLALSVSFVAIIA